MTEEAREYLFEFYLAARRRQTEDPDLGDIVVVRDVERTLERNFSTSAVDRIERELYRLS